MSTAEHIPEQGHERTARTQTGQRPAVQPAIDTRSMTGLLLQLQRTAGNAAVNQLLRRHEAQRREQMIARQVAAASVPEQQDAGEHGDATGLDEATVEHGFATRLQASPAGRAAVGEIAATGPEPATGIEPSSSNHTAPQSQRTGQTPVARRVQRARQDAVQRQPGAAAPTSKPAPAVAEAEEAPPVAEVAPGGPAFAAAAGAAGGPPAAGDGTAAGSRGAGRAMPAVIQRVYLDSQDGLKAMNKDYGDIKANLKATLPDQFSQFEHFIEILSDPSSLEKTEDFYQKVKQLIAKFSKAVADNPAKLQTFKIKKIQQFLTNLDQDCDKRIPKEEPVTLTLPPVTPAPSTPNAPTGLNSPTTPTPTTPMPTELEPVTLTLPPITPAPSIPMTPTEPAELQPSAAQPQQTLPSQPINAAGPTVENDPAFTGLGESRVFIPANKSYIDESSLQSWSSDGVTYVDEVTPGVQYPTLTGPSLLEASLTTYEAPAGVQYARYATLAEVENPTLTGPSLLEASLTTYSAPAGVQYARYAAPAEVTIPIVLANQPLFTSQSLKGAFLSFPNDIYCTKLGGGRVRVRNGPNIKEYWAADTSFGAAQGRRIQVKNGAALEGRWAPTASLGVAQGRRIQVRNGTALEDRWAPAASLGVAEGRRIKMKKGDAVKEYWAPETSLGSGAPSYKKMESPLFPVDPQPEHVKQTTLGDCYLQSVLMSIARTDPAHLKGMMQPHEGPNVTVTFYKDGAAVPITIEKSVPTGAADEPLFNDGALWVRILQKAFVVFAQQHGKYGTALQPGNAVAKYEDIASGQEHFLYPVFYGTHTLLHDSEPINYDPTKDLIATNKEMIKKLLEWKQPTQGQAMNLTLSASLVAHMQRALALIPSVTGSLQNAFPGPANALTALKLLLPDAIAEKEAAEQDTPVSALAKVQGVIERARTIAAGQLKGAAEANSTIVDLITLFELLNDIKEAGHDQSEGQRFIYSQHAYTVVDAQIKTTDNQALVTPTYGNLDLNKSKLTLRNPHHANSPTILGQGPSTGADDTGKFDLSLAQVIRNFSMMDYGLVAKTGS